MFGRFDATEKRLEKEREKVQKLETNQASTSKKLKITERKIVKLEKSDLYNSNEEERKRKNETRLTNLEANFESASRNLQVLKKPGIDIVSPFGMAHISNDFQPRIRRRGHRDMDPMGPIPMGDKGVALRRAEKQIIEFVLNRHGLGGHIDVEQLYRQSRYDDMISCLSTKIDNDHEHMAQILYIKKLGRSRVSAQASRQRKKDKKVTNDQISGPQSNPAPQGHPLPLEEAGLVLLLWPNLETRTWCPLQ